MTARRRRSCAIFLRPGFLLTGLFAAIGLVGWTQPAHAAGPDEAAQQAFRAGVDAARQERWSDALAAFEKAYGLSPRPVVLINLAGVQVRTGRLIEATKNYRRILSDPPSADTTAFRKAAADVLPSLEARIPRIRLRPTGLAPSDIVEIDGQPLGAGAIGAERTLDPGEHTLIVARDGTERARVLFALAESERRDIALPLPAPTAGTTSAAPGVVGIAASSPRDAGPYQPRSERRWWASPWTWVVAGALVAGASVTAIVLVNGRDSTFSGNIPPGQISVR